MAIDDVKEFLEGDTPHFSRHIGLKITKCTPELVEGTLEARPELSNRHGVLHGGAIMTLVLPSLSPANARPRPCTSRGRSYRKIPQSADPIVPPLARLAAAPII